MLGCSGVCTDIDECASGLASCASPAVATCVNTRGGYFCSCNDGYEGDGRQCVASPSTADAHISIAMDYEKTVAAAGGVELLKEALIDAILQAIPGLADRTRIEVTSIYEGSIHALIRIHPPSPEATAYLEGSDVPRQLTAAEVLLALQEQLTQPLSPLRTGPFGEYAAYATIERYMFLDRAAASGTFDLLAFLTDWLPAWLREAVPREVLAALELIILLLCVAFLAICCMRALKRSRRSPPVFASQNIQTPYFVNVACFKPTVTADLGRRPLIDNETAQTEASAEPLCQTSRVVFLWNYLRFRLLLSRDKIRPVSRLQLAGMNGGRLHRAFHRKQELDIWNPSWSAAAWRWGLVNEEAGGPRLWHAVGESDAALLEHAYLQAWARVELSLNGRPYAVDPFFPDAEANIAAPADNLQGPLLFLSSRNASFLKIWYSYRTAFWGPLAVSLPSVCLSETGRIGRLANSRATDQWSSCRVPPRSCLILPRLLQLSEDSDGFRIVRRKRYKKQTFGKQPCSSNPQCSVSSNGETHKMTVWRAFPKVDLGACGDSSVVRQILIDGVDVALQRGGKRRLAPAGIALAVAHFMELSFPVRVVLPHWFAHNASQHIHLFTESPELLIEALKEDDLLVALPDPDKPVWRPSFATFKTDKGASDPCNAECTIDLCKTFNAAFCSNDFSQFQHMMGEGHPLFNDYMYISARSCLYAFDGDSFYHILDSQGRGKFVDTLFFRKASS
ncbi:hypothetical protein Efla_004024 [Eimeria flavescens]